MLASSLFLLVSLTCLGATHPAQSGVDPQWMLLRERRAVRGTVMAGSFYSAPLRKQECENCNQLAEEHLVDEGSARADEEPIPNEVPALIDESKAEEAPEIKPKSPKASKAIPSDNDDDDVPAPRKGGRRSGSVYKNFFPMTFGGRVVRDVQEPEGGDADVQANAKAEPEDEDEEEEDEDEDDASPRSGGRSTYENFFPMTFNRKVREAEGVEGGRGGGGVISIANSFSKGRGAVASSSATAYGTPNNNNDNNNQHRSTPPAE